MHSMFIEHRRDPRENVTLPARLGGAEAMARNVSASGMYIEFDGPDPLGTRISVQVDLPEAGMRLDADGEIVRIEHLGGKTGIAVRLRDAQLLPV